MIDLTVEPECRMGRLCRLRRITATTTVEMVDHRLEMMECRLFGVMLVRRMYLLCRLRRLFDSMLRLRASPVRRVLKWKVLLIIVEPVRGAVK